MTDQITTVVADVKAAVTAAAPTIAKVEAEASFLRANWGKVSIAVLVLVAAAFLLRGCI